MGAVGEVVVEWKLIASLSMSLWWSGYSFLLSVCPCQIVGVGSLPIWASELDG